MALTLAQLSSRVCCVEPACWVHIVSREAHTLYLAEAFVAAYKRQKEIAASFPALAKED